MRSVNRLSREVFMAFPGNRDHKVVDGVDEDRGGRLSDHGANRQLAGGRRRFSLVVISIGAMEPPLPGTSVIHSCARRNVRSAWSWAKKLPKVVNSLRAILSCVIRDGCK